MSLSNYDCDEASPLPEVANLQLSPDPLLNERYNNEYSVTIESRLSSHHHERHGDLLPDRLPQVHHHGQYLSAILDYLLSSTRLSLLHCILDVR